MKNRVNYTFDTYFKSPYFSLVISILDVSYNYVSYKWIHMIREKCKNYAKIYSSFMSILLWQKWKFLLMLTKKPEIIKMNDEKNISCILLVLLLYSWKIFYNFYLKFSPFFRIWLLVFYTMLLSFLFIKCLIVI